MLDILIPYLINFSAVFILIRGLYYRSYKRTDLFLTFFGFNTIIFDYFKPSKSEHWRGFWNVRGI